MKIIDFLIENSLKIFRKCLIENMAAIIQPLVECFTGAEMHHSALISWFCEISWYFNPISAV